VGCSESTNLQGCRQCSRQIAKEQHRRLIQFSKANAMWRVQQRAQERTVGKPVTPDQPTTEQQKVADAQVNAAEKSPNKRNKSVPPPRTYDKEQTFQATQARDAYVKDWKTNLPTQTNKLTR